MTKLNKCQLTPLKIDQTTKILKEKYLPLKLHGYKPKFPYIEFSRLFQKQFLIPLQYFATMAHIAPKLLY